MSGECLEGLKISRAYESKRVNLEEGVSLGRTKGEEDTHGCGGDEAGEDGEREEGDGETHEEMSSGGYRGSGSGGRDD